MNREQEIETFIEAQEAANNAENNIRIEYAINELKKTNDALLRILLKSGE